MSREQRCPRCDTVLREHDVLCPRCTLAESLDTEALSASGPGFLDDLPLTGDSLLIADRYRVVETIARGGMGVVYKAWQENLGRVVAVKMLLGGIHAADSFKKRFVQEAKAAARLQHPCIVKIFDWGEDNGQPYFSMEYVEGETLTRLAAVQPLEPLHAAALVKRIAEAIGYAHEQGILHRDLKPSNVLVDKAGNVRITDFGLAKDQTIHDLTASGEAMGSPGYSPPEQLNGENSKIGPESDVYGLGAVLYYLITGRPPFVASSLHESFRAVNESPPVSPRLLNSSVPRDLETICLACLEKNPGQRYRTAFELGLELERYLSNQPIRRRPITPMERGWRWCKRQPVIASLLLILALVLNGGIWGILRQQAKTAAANRELAGALVRSELQTANSLLEQKDVGGGLAYLADLARQFPTNHVVSSRLLNALNESAFPIPMFGPVHQGGGFTWMRFPLNGKYLVTIAHDGAVRLLSPQNGQVVAGPFPYSSSITNADVSPDGELLAGIGPNNTIQVMQLRTGKILPPVVHPEVFSVAFGLEGELISRSADGVEVVWDIVARKEVRKGGALAWDVGGAEEVRKRFGKEARVLRALMPAFSDVGRSVCTGLVYYTNSVYPQVSALIWDKATGELLSWPSSTGVAGVASNIFQMSNVVITASASGAAVDIIARGKAGVYARCDALGGKLILAENLASDFPATYLSTSNPEFSVGYNEQSSEFYVYGFVRGEAPKRVATEKRVDHLSAWEASLTGQALAVGGANGIVFVLHAPAGVRKDWSAIQPIRLRDPIQSLAFNADSRHLAVLLRTGDLWEWDVPPYIPCEDYTFTVGEEGFGLASPDGTRALLFESTDDWGFYYNLVSLPDRKPILKLPKSNVGFFFRDSRYFFHARDWPLSGVAITNGIFIRSAINGDLLGTIQGEGFALDAEALMTGDLGLNGQFLLTEVGGRSACFDVRAGALASFLPQGLRYGRFHEGGNQISGVIRNKLVVVRTGDGALVREYTVDGSVFDKLTVPPNFSHDAKWVLLTTERTVEVVDLARQTRIKAPFDSGAPITSVGFSPNGDLAFAAANDGTVILWNPSSALSGLRMLRHPIAEVAVKPANGAVLTISSDGSRLWDPSTGELLYRGRQFEGSWLPDVITEFYHANLEVSRLSWACFGARSLVHEDVFSTHEPIPSLMPDLVEALAEST
ncbi:MAG: WD40 repeat domain-containing serine/threonine-protein kinase [Verrucomicrobiota bacterium]